MVLPRHEYRETKRSLLDRILGRPEPKPTALELFYTSPARSGSEEMSLGDRWSLEGEPNATFAVGWIEATGEIYALRLMEPETGRMRLGLFRLLGVYAPHMWGESDPPMSVIGVCKDKRRFLELLAGWQEEMTRPNSLEWLTDRLSS